MSNVLHIEDGFGGHVGEPSRMIGKPGAHSAYARGADLVVEWYDFGADAPYESANFLIFARSSQRDLATAIGADPAMSPHMLSNRVACRFDTYFQVKEFAEAGSIPFQTKVDFQP